MESRPIEISIGPLDQRVRVPSISTVRLDAKAIKCGQCLLGREFEDRATADLHQLMAIRSAGHREAISVPVPCLQHLSGHASIVAVCQRAKAINDSQFAGGCHSEYRATAIRAARCSCSVKVTIRSLNQTGLG